MTLGQKVLLLASGGVTLVSFSYGVNPAFTLELLYGLQVEGVNQTHIYRGIMGLYLGFCGFWMYAALIARTSLERTGLISLAVFMFGIASGRGLSLIADGAPHWLFCGYLLTEIGMGGLALLALKRADHFPAT